MCRVSVIVPTHNRAAFLPSHLDRVLGQTFESYEAIYVNDRSSDETSSVLADYAARYPERLRVVTSDRGAPGPARNAGARIATGELLLFTDDDVTVERDWIARMVAAYEQCGCAALCGGIKPESMQTPTERYLHYRVQGSLGYAPRKLMAAPMMSFLIARDVFFEVGAFLDEPLRAAEDWELCHRIRAAEKCIWYEPSIEVIHQYQRERGPAERRMREAGAAGVTIWRKHHRGALLYTMYSLIRCILSPFWTPFRYPIDLYALAVHMEYIFAEARLLEYVRTRKQ